MGRPLYEGRPSFVDPSGERERTVRRLVCQAVLAGSHLAVGFDFGDAGDLQRGAELLGGSAFVAGFAKLLAGRNKALGARLLGAFDAASGDMGLFGQTGAAIITARLSVSGGCGCDQAGERKCRRGNNCKKRQEIGDKRRADRPWERFLSFRCATFLVAVAHIDNPL